MRTNHLLALSAALILLGCPTEEPADDDATAQDDDDTAPGNDDDSIGDDDSAEANQPPTGDLDLEVDGPHIGPAPVALQVTFSDPDAPLAEMVSVTLAVLLDETEIEVLDLTTELGVIDQGDGTYEYAYETILEAGDYDFVLTLDDGANDAAEITEDLHLLENEAPNLEEEPDLAFTVRDFTEKTISFTDPNEPWDTHEVEVTGLPAWTSAYGVDEVGGFVWIEGEATDNGWEEGTTEITVALTDARGMADQRSYLVEAVPAGIVQVTVFDWETLDPIDGTQDGTTVTLEQGNDIYVGSVDTGGMAEVWTNEDGTHTLTINSTDDGAGNGHGGRTTDVDVQPASVETTSAEIGTIPAYELTAYVGMTSLLHSVHGNGVMYGLPDTMRDGTDPVTIDESGDAGFDQTMTDVIFPYVMTLGVLPREPELVPAGTGLVTLVYGESPMCTGPTLEWPDYVTVTVPHGFFVYLDFEDDQDNYVLVFHEVFGHGILGLGPYHIEEGGVLDSNPNNGAFGDFTPLESVTLPLETAAFRLIFNMKYEDMSEYFD